MQQYKNLHGNSNVVAYEYGLTYINVMFNSQFGPNPVYVYTYRSADSTRIETMKMLANQGYGLNAYINRYVRKNYERIIK